MNGTTTIPGVVQKLGTFARTDLHNQLLWIIAIRAMVLLLGLNVADPLGLLPARLGPFPYLATLNLFTLVLTATYLLLYFTRWPTAAQVRLQVVVDLLVATLLVANTQGADSGFASLYLLVIICCSLTLGRNAAMIGAAVSTILYAGIITAGHAGLIHSSPGETKALIYRAALNVFGYFAVAMLGTTLSQRLHAVQEQLEEKIDSLEQLRALNEHIVRSIRSGLITTDLAGRIAVFNSTAEELTGRKVGEVLNGPVRDVIGGDLWTRISAADLFRDARPLRYENWFTLPNAKRKFLGFSISPLVDQNQRLLGYVLSFQDLTEIKRLEEEVRLKDRMAAIGKMAAGIAHEIRNPLTSIQGSVEILRGHAGLSGTDRRLLDILIREGDRLNQFVADFLQFARPADHVKQKVDLVPVLGDFAALLRNSTDVRENHNIILSLGETPIRVLANADQLRQVFWNLAQNALRAMPEGGSLTISAQPGQDLECHVAFEDTGTGMPPEQKEQLFQPFQPSFAGGVGLGLSIVFQIVEDHCGKIRVESENGRGTKFIVSFPSTD
jgi:two-component system sensor histidine kinase PilS (NtrC family)